LHIHQAGSSSEKSQVSQAEEFPEHPSTTAGIAAPSELWSQGSKTHFTPSRKQAWVAGDLAHSQGSCQRL